MSKPESRTDAILFACKKVLNDHRDFLDSHNVRDVQLTITLGKDGVAHVTTSHRTETIVVDCFESKRYVFT